MSVYDLPIYREYFQEFLEILVLLEELKKNNYSHQVLINKTYLRGIEIFPNLNAGYNYWNLKEKLEIYNKVRVYLSQFGAELKILFNLNVINKDYNDLINNCIKYIGSLIRKLEPQSVIENEKKSK